MTDLSQFLPTFYEESFEGLEIMETGLLNLDIGAADAEEINTIFRAAHSIKGGSATFGLGDVAEFTHLMETLLDELRDRRREVSQPVVELLLQSVDCLSDMLNANKSDEPLDQQRIGALQKELETMLGGESESAVQESAETVTEAGSGWRIVFKPDTNFYFTGNDPLRILNELGELGDMKVSAELSTLPPFDEMSPEESYLSWIIELSEGVERAAIDEAFAWVEDDCELQITPIGAESAAEESSTSEPVAAPVVQSAADLVDKKQKVDQANREKPKKTTESTSIRVNIDKVDQIINLVGELVITQSMLSTLGENFDMGQLHLLRDGLAQLERNTRELQEDVMRMRMRMRMLPISFTFNRFPRLVHDLSSKLGKKVELVMSGEGTELDKTLIEKLSDPLVHLVRNSLDHGIEEKPEDRVAAGKSDTGTIWLNAYHKGGNIVIEVKDDGRGINTDKILAKAIRSGLVSADDELTHNQICELIFHPGLSTAEVVSDVSGRGVGMDVVRRNIQSLGGGVEITSELGVGSCITVRLPLTLAILDGQTVAVGKEHYIVPLVSIIESIQIKPGTVRSVGGRGETFELRGEYLPIIRLSDVFSVETKVRELTEGLLVVVEGDGKQVGLFVDDLLGQQQVVIKSLEANYKKVDGLSGATILGDGSVALILDIPSLIRISY